MQSRNYNKIQYFKNRFVQILNYLGSDNAKSAAMEIEKLPDSASDGYHDAYLTAKIISISLSYMNKNEFKRFKKDFILSNLLTALFGQSEMENMQLESIDNVFSYCNANPEESLEESLYALIGDWESDDFKSVYQDLKELKYCCNSFIEFYEKNKSDLDKASCNFPDSIMIKQTHKGPKAEDLQYAKYLSNPEEKLIMVNNGKAMINNLRPCHGLVVLAENDNKEVTCLTHHNYSFSFSDVKDAINEIKLKGYIHEVRFFITGGNLNTFSNALNLLMDYWNENKTRHIAHADFYLIPSPHDCWSYCLVDLIDGQCSIQAGSELYDNDFLLCAERNIPFENGSITNYFEEKETSEEDSSLICDDLHETSDESSISSDISDEIIYSDQKRKWMMFHNIERKNESSEDELRVLKRPKK